MAIFSAGGVMLIVGLWLFVQAHGICIRIVHATTNQPGGLSRSDLWNHRWFRKRRKLRHLVDGNDCPKVRADAVRALRVETISRLLCVGGVILMFIGAQVGKE